ncbi:MAG: alkaline phosphatase D family protein [Burkholderiaceae bacterium]
MSVGTPSGKLRIAFGSCIDQNKPQPIWDTILAAKPDLFIFGGDNVYASDPPYSLDKLEKAYAMLAANPGFAKLRQTVPHIAIWDDHDYGKNDAGAEFADKQVSKDAFLKFWQIPATDARHQRDGLYHAQITGAPGQRLQIILLDVRWSRSAWKPTDQRDAPGKERYVPDVSPSKTMLGEAQWHWLEAQLREPADLRLMVSGIQVVTQGHGWESWSRFPAERARLYALIASTRARGVVFLSGDRHIGALYAEPISGPYPMLEMTSSGMTHAWAQAKEAGPNRLGELVTENHFGLIDVDWAARRVGLSIQNVAGVTVRQLQVALPDLVTR